MKVKRRIQQAARPIQPGSNDKEEGLPSKVKKEEAGLKKSRVFGEQDSS